MELVEKEIIWLRVSSGKSECCFS